MIGRGRLINLCNRYIVKTRLKGYYSMDKFTEFKQIPESPNFPKEEEEIVKFWDEIDAFKQQLERTKDQKPYTFYDGPPFATGLPHYGHICAGTIKDVITRYASMTGHHVPRKFGWDCHGLPIEFQIDKDFDFKTKADREKFGIKNYNDECRKIVMRYSSEWETIVKRLGRWIDFKDDYKTMDLSFMESVWWVFKQIFDKGYVYRGCKIMPYSNGCNTAVSNFEAGLNYQDVIDPAVYVLMPLVEEPETNLVVWTTTPWTLPTNLGCVVHPDFDYVKLRDRETGKVLILAECRLGEIYKVKGTANPKGKEGKPKKDKKKKNKNQKDEGEEVQEEEKEEADEKGEANEAPYEVLGKMKGKDLEGKSYTPLFDYYKERAEAGCFKVLCDTFVTHDAGTGIVHASPAYGEDDYRVCLKYKIITPDDPCISVDDNGFYLPAVVDYKGMYIKDADKQIVKDLKAKGRMFKDTQFKHSYPFCWRSNTPLIYKAVNQWFIKVTDMKENLLANNLKSNWVPKPVQEGRFHNWLENANDWCFSRDRFWGNPIPIWISDDGEEIVCVGSIQELKELSGASSITDLHKEFIDEITIPSKMGKGTLRRIPEVFDCWFESGSMPFASQGYPFKMKEEEFSKKFPADFIGEGLDQTRGWFYTLNVIATAVRNDTPYKNLIVNGIVLAKDGEKMSKSKKNYERPEILIDKFGADSIRLYLMNSPLLRADSLKFNEKEVQDVLRDIFLPWFNVYRFLIQNISRWEEQHKQKFQIADDYFSSLANFNNVMDKWMIAANQDLIKYVRHELESYRLYSVVEKKLVFLDQLSNWYVRLNRRRLKGTEGDKDWEDSLKVLFSVLMNSMLLMAPYVPFIVETFYQNMRKVLAPNSKLLEQSIHFVDIPQFNESLIDSDILNMVDKMQRIIQSVRTIRDHAKIPVKQGVKGLKIVCKDEATLQLLKVVEAFIVTECNVAEISYTTDWKKYINYKLIPNHKLLGEKYKAAYDGMKKIVMNLNEAQVTEFLEKNSLTIGDLHFDKECFTPKAEFFPTKEANTDIGGQLDFAVVLDMTITRDLIDGKLAREFINRVQKIRQKQKFNITDKIIVTYEMLPNPKAQEVHLANAVKSQLNMIKTTLTKHVEERHPDTVYNFVCSSECEVEGETFNVAISNNVLLPVHDALKKDYESEYKSVLKLLGCTTPLGQKEIVVKLNGKDLKLTEGVHYNAIY